MIVIIANVFYVLIAVAMIVLILLQRGAGAAAGSGFGGGASATVFGARGSANFLSRSTAVLAALFFLLSLGMGVYLGGHQGAGPRPADDLGVMSGAAAPKPAPATVPPAAGGDVPQPSSAPAASGDKPATPPPAKAPADKPAANDAGIPDAGKPQDDGKDGK